MMDVAIAGRESHAWAGFAGRCYDDFYKLAQQWTERLGATWRLDDE